MDLQQPVSESVAFLKISRNIDYLSPQVSSLGFLFPSILITFLLLFKVFITFIPRWHTVAGREKNFVFYATFNIFGLTKLQLFCGHKAAAFKNP
jgi:hypothetical protein